MARKGLASHPTRGGRGRAAARPTPRTIAEDMAARAGLRPPRVEEREESHPDRRHIPEGRGRGAVGGRGAARAAPAVRGRSRSVGRGEERLGESSRAAPSGGEAMEGVVVRGRGRGRRRRSGAASEDEEERRQRQKLADLTPEGERDVLFECSDLEDPDWDPAAPDGESTDSEGGQEPPRVVIVRAGDPEQATPVTGPEEEEREVEPRYGSARPRLERARGGHV